MTTMKQLGIVALLTTACILLFSAGSAVAQNGGICNRIPFCLTCPETSSGSGKYICTQCFKMYAVNDGNYPFCVPCKSFDGCWVCSNSSVCEKCQYPGKYGPDFNGRATCSPCAPNCRYCGISGGGKCDTCVQGYSLVAASKTCSACPANCGGCTQSANTCDYCMSGYYKASPTSCLPCPGNCTYCTEPSTCIYCNKGFFWNAKLGACLPCAPPCQTCTNFTTCTSCVAGYSYNGNSECFPCFGKNCATCAGITGSCTTCLSGMAPSSTGDCTCAPNCSDCVTSGYGLCDQCKKGFTLTSAKLCQAANNAAD